MAPREKIMCTYQELLPCKKHTPKTLAKCFKKKTKKPFPKFSQEK